MVDKFSLQVNLFLYQTSFNLLLIENLVLPLWEQISILFEGSREAVDNLNANLKRLEEEKNNAVAAAAEVK